MRIGNNDNDNIGSSPNYSVATKMNMKGGSSGYSKPVVRIEQAAAWNGNYVLQIVAYSDFGGIRIIG